MTHRIKVIVNDKPYIVEVANLEAMPLTVMVNGLTYTVQLDGAPTETEAASAAEVNDEADVSVRQIKAPMPGTILDIKVQVGDPVTYGQTLCALEAMKMKSAIRAPRAGVIAEVAVREGQSVAHGDVLIVFA